MKNLGQLMKQAQEMQSKVQEMQDRLATIEVSGVSGGGMVEVVLTGKGEARKISIDKALVDPAEVEVLEDLLVAAINDARSKADALSADEMQKLTGGISLPPGFKLPF